MTVCGNTATELGNISRPTFEFGFCPNLQPEAIFYISLVILFSFFRESLTIAFYVRSNSGGMVGSNNENNGNVNEHF